MAEQGVAGFCGKDEIRAHPAGDRLAVVGRHWRIKPQHSLVVRHIELPAQPDQREAAPHQKSVAHLGLSRKITAAAPVIEEPNHRLASAVRNLEQRGAVAPVQILGPEDVKIGGEFDQALFVALRLVEINDDLVVRIVRVDCEVDFGDDLLVSARRAELLAVEQVGARDDFYAGDSGLNGQDEQQQRDCLQNYVFASHSSLYSEYSSLLFIAV